MRWLRVVMVLVALIGLAPAARAQDARISPDERAKLLRYLADSEKEFLSLLDGVTAEQWDWKASADRWSVGETARHILVSEDYLFGQAMAAMNSPADSEWRSKTSDKTALLERVLPDRSRRVQAPEPLNPAGAGRLTREQVIATFREKRARTILFAQTTELPLLEHLTKGLFPIFDPLNAYQFVLYIPLHNIRHNKQIAEVQATAGYPKR